MIQDVEVPIDRLVEFMDVFAREIPIEPVWFCPLRQRSADDVWELYRLDPHTLYVNVGFWSSVALEPGEDPTTHNRLIEELVDSLDGRKSLYSSSYYDREHFWRLYNGPVYEVLKKTYDPDGRLLDLYEKCVEAHDDQASPWQTPWRRCCPADTGGGLRRLRRRCRPTRRWWSSSSRPRRCRTWSRRRVSSGWPAPTSRASSTSRRPATTPCCAR